MEQQKQITVPEALGALATEVVKLDQRTIELAAANQATMATLTAMTATLETIMEQHGIAFRKISELFIGLGCDIQGAELAELRRLFNLPSEPGEHS